MTEAYMTMRDNYIELVKKLILSNGSLNPHITVLGKHKEDSAEAVVYVEIPAKYMNTEAGKELFIEKMIPDIAKDVKAKFDIGAVAWASEAWLRVADANNPDAIKDWKALPVQKEVLIMTLESADENTTTVFEIKRKGKQVNEDGNLVDHIELVELPEFKEGKTAEGRFTGLYKKFINNP
jgi:hypothetical protein